MKQHANASSTDITTRKRPRTANASIIWMVLVALALLVGDVSTAWAEEPAAPADEQSEAEKKMELAGKHYQEGIKLFRQELYKGAMEAFKRAHKLAPNFPKPIFNIAKSYEKLGVSDKCVEWYGKYVTVYKKANGADPPDMVDINNTVAKCKLGMQLEITVESFPVGAEVYVNSSKTVSGTTPYTTRLDPGEHTLLIKAKLHAPLMKKIVVKKGESTKFVFKLDKLETIGQVLVTSNIKGATIYVNGKPEGRTPRAEPIMLNEGPYQISVDKEGYTSVTRSVNLKANQTVSISANLFLKDPPSTWKVPAGWTLVGLGAASILVGAIIPLEEVRIEEFQGEYKNTPEFRKRELAQQLGFGIGAGLAGLGVIFLIWEAADSSQVRPEDEVTHGPSPKVRPMVSASPDGGLVGAGVQF